MFRSVVLSIVVFLLINFVIFNFSSSDYEFPSTPSSQIVEVTTREKSLNVTKLEEQNSTSTSSTTAEHPKITTQLPKTVDSIVPDLRGIHRKPTRGENPIMFLDTSCILGGEVSDPNSRGFILKPRSACAVESTARTNPNRNIYVIYSCPIVGKIEESRPHVIQLLKYKNVKIWHLDILNYVKYTPLEKWNFHEKVNTSKWPLSHASDILRYLSLWKYGGTYLDMDFVIVRYVIALNL